MDVVGTFNHLIPSDQLEESLLLGQNLESEASDEFGTGHHLLEDSLKNMLSDKDPMLGSASTQFHLLDNEDASYEAAGSTGLGGISESRGACGVSRGSMARSRGQRGRARKTSALSSRKPSCAADQEPGKSGFTQGRSSESLSKLAGSKVAGRCDRSGLNNQQESAEAQEDPVATAQDKEEGAAQSTVCSKVGPSMNPVVVLRRLTVTVGGYKIELLPGPSKVPPTPGSSAAPSLGFLDTEEGVEGVAFSVNAPDGQVVEHVTATQDLEKYCAAEAPAELGPYVNPNEVQESSDVLLSGSPPTVDVCTADTEARNQLDSQQPDLGSVKGTPSINSGGGETRQRVQANKSASLSMSVGKEGQDQKTSTHKQLKSKLSPGPPDKKNLVPNTSKRAGGVPKTPLLKNVARGNVQSIQPPKGKPAAMAAKRRTEHLQTYPPSKMLRGQDKRWSKQDVRPKSPSPFHPVIKRLLPGTGGPDGTQKQHLGTQAGNSKASRLPFGPKPSHPQAAVARPGHLPREPSEDDDPEKCRTKKPERGFQRHRSRSVRSLSVDEPPLFIPDNAPLVKKEATEEDTAAGEATWDPSKHCGFCRKPHSNRFMVGCGRCDDWFHGECVGLDLAKAQQMEREDQEYVCLKCCAEEDQKVESEDHGAASAERQVKVEQSQENKPVVKHEKLGLPSSVGGVRKDSVDRRSLEDRAAESRASSGSDQRLHVPRRLKVSGDTAHRLGAHERLETKKSRSSSATSKKPSVEQIRRNVRDSLKDILMKRLSESDLKVSAERAANVATKTEKELFAFFRDTDSKYKSKYRSLMFNLKDAKNSVLFKRVLKGEISPHHLIRMTPEELASKELAAWRQRENRHAIEMIEKEQREVDRRPITKITHKGEIEIENQEPENEPEAPDTEPEPAPKPPEEPETAPPEPEPESTKDTTAQHKTHLFDLNCKICTGRMPPPVEDATTKVVKVATTVMRRQTSMDGEGQTCASPQAEEESLVSSRVLSSIDERLSCTSGREDETSFLDRLELLWKGFVNMPSVAKFVTKAYPVSGALDHLTEDLPDSIQVGGRISPQTVWDYMEKIRASGTKELCLIRFAPVTEEDEISYTLLYAYFSSRRRYGVVANNMKHVKDMYLIPLGGSEKIPHQLVPFDGPGLETNRPNLLLGLIIRQRLKRDFGVLMSVDMPEASAARFLSENRSKLDSGSEAGSTLTGEDYLNSLKVARTTETANPQPSAMEGTDVGEAPLTTEGSLQEAAKPLRFLPGVLVGRGGRSSPCADPASRTLVAVPQGLLGTSEKEVNRQAPPGDSVAKGNGHGRSPASNGLRLDRFVIKKKDSKCSHPELQQKTASVDDPFSKELGGDPSMTAVETAPKAGSPAHSTEGVFPKLPSWAGRGLDKAPSSSKADCLGEQAKHEGLALQAVTVSDSGSVASEAISSSSAAGPVQPATGILKTSSTVYQAERQDSRPPAEEGVAEQKAIRPNAQPISQERPLASVPTVDTQPSPHQPVGDAQPISTILSGSKAEDRTLRVPLLPTPPASVFGHGGQGLPAAMFPPVQATEFQYQQVPTQTFQSQGNAAPLFQPLDQQGGFAYRGALPPFPQPNHSHSQPASPWLGATPPAAAFHPSQHGPSGPALSIDPLRCPESSRPSATTKEDKASEQRYGDSWERQPRQADESYGRDGAEQHGRPRHCGDPHHERKGGPRDRDREHGKPREPQPEDGGSWERNRSRSRSRSRDGSSRERHRRHDEKHRDGRSRHRNHSGGEHSRGDRHHKQHRERDRDKHRRDSYDKGSRASKDASKDGRS